MRCVIDFFDRGRVRRQVLLLGHLFLRLKKHWIISCPVVCISFVIHTIQRSILASPSASSPTCVTTSWVVMLFSGVESLVFIFWLQRPEIFLLIFWDPHHQSMLWICLVILSKLIVLSLPLLYLIGLDGPFSSGTFLYCSNLWKCSTSDLLNLRKLSYSSSSVLGCSHAK
jgi:hypothetical protein